MVELKTVETVDTSPFKKLVVTIGELPTSFVESMTYYECLAWLVNYIQNTVIPAVNNNGEAVIELQEKFVELKTFVDTYFDNLDVQEEINNKLDAMAEAGTLQEIITEYIQSNVAWTFDTVADMKLSENLVAGSYAQTLGFHSLNDGGGALYHITDTGTANEMDVIAVDTLYANLVYGNEINVKQFGAYGDDTHNDYSAITRAAQIAETADAVLKFPKATYKITEQLTLKGIVVDCEGTLDNALALIVGANSNASTVASMHIYKCNDIQIEGSKNSYFNIEHAGNITVFANGSVANIASTAYCKIDGNDCTSITINGINNGWINENVFNIKRCNGDITITGDGTYSHNNNHFENICVEGSSNKIQIDYGHNNYINYRGEDYPSVIMGSDVTKTFGNVINKQYASAYGLLINSPDFNSVNSLNFIGREYLPNLKCINLIDINKNNVKQINTTLYLNDNNKIAGSWANEYLSEKLNAAYPFIIYVKCDTACQRIFFTCYDENDNPIQGNVSGPSISWNSTNNDYRLGSGADKILLTFAPSTAVKKVQLKVQCQASSTYDRCQIFMYMPFVNTETFENTITTNGKYSNNIPSTLTSNNPTWAVGDIVWCSDATKGVAGWYCTTAGTGASSVWKGITLEA